MAIRAVANRLPIYCTFYASSSSSSSPAISSRLRIACSPRHHPVFRCQSTAPSNAMIESVVELKEKETGKSSNGWKIKMLYDGDCPLCMREVNMLKERNKTYGAVKFVDISSDDYSPAENQGLDYKTVMGSIHAILSDGTVVRDVEAFRRLYEEVGLGWVYAITKYEPILQSRMLLLFASAPLHCSVLKTEQGSQDVMANLILSHPIATIASSVYSIWAKYRFKITGRPPLDDILEARKNKMVKACTDDKVCKM